MVYINLGKYEGYPEIPLIQGKGVWGTIYFDEKFIPITSDIIDGIYDWYLVSNYGKVYNKYAGEYLKIYECSKANVDDKTYYSTNLKTIYGYKSVMIHRLVMACFYPELGPIGQKLDINHKDGNPHNNYISYNDKDRGNIEWGTRSYNILHAYRIGLHHVGEDNVHSNITNNEAMQIIQLLATTDLTSKEIVAIVGGNTTAHIVDDIRKKQCWTHLSKDYEFHQRINRQFTEEDIHHFCISFQNHKDDGYGINENCRIALIENGFEPDNRFVETLRKIYVRKYYKHIISQYIW